MKRVITLIAIFTSILFYAQEFKITTDFKITNIKSVLNNAKINDSETLDIYLYKEDEPISKLIKMAKDDLDFFMNATIKVLKNPELNNTKQIIKVEFEFLACCSNYETLYFIETTNNEFIKLPQLDYMFCEYATDKMEYIFPSQKFGQANKILTTESYLDIHQKTESVKIVNTQIWEEMNAVEVYSYNYRD